MEAQTETSMQVPSTPLTWQVGGGVPELELLPPLPLDPREA